MQPSPYQSAVVAIDSADLTPGQKLAALSLLAIVHADNGFACLSWLDAKKVLGRRSEGSVRNLLTYLKRAGLIHYSTNDRIDLTFEAWRGATMQLQSAASSPAAVSRFTAAGEYDPLSEPPPEAQSPLQVNPITAAGEPVHRFPPTPPGRLVGPDPADPEANQPNQVCAPELLTQEQKRGIRLLMDPDVGLSGRQAARLARSHTFDWLMRQVFAWRQEVATGKVDGAGALVHRLDASFTPGQLTPADRAAPLYRRHMSKDDDAEREAAERRRKYIPAELEEIIIG